MPKISKTTKPTPKKTKKSAGGLGVVNMSDEVTLMRYIIVVQGPRGAGKTWLASTASALFPAKTPAAKKTTLDDMLWLSYDFGATDGFAEANMAVPCIDINLLISDPDIWSQAGFHKPPTIVEATRYAAETAVQRCQTGETDIVVVDTVSSFNMHLDDHFNRIAPDKWRKFDMMFEAHKRLHGTLKFGCKKVIYLTHSKALHKDSSDAQKKRSLATRSPGMPDIVPNITGQGSDAYINDSSLELVILANKEVGKKGALRRVVYPLQHQGFEAKNRFELSLEPEEEPHLGKMFKKIEKGIGR